VCATGLTCLSGLCVMLPDPGFTDPGGQDVPAPDEAAEAAPDATEPETADGDDLAADAAADPAPDPATDPAPDPAGEATAEVTLPQPPWFACTAGDLPATATVVTAFDKADQYFAGDTKNFRQVDASVDFPSGGSWQAILMRVDLECPAAGECDHWDRFANVFLVDDAGTDHEQRTELARYVTPYGKGMCLLIDATAFAPVLKGTRTVRSFIDTWVGPGFQPGNGDGWRVTVRFVFHPGAAAAGASFENVWGYGSVEVGDPSKSLASQMPDQQVDVAAGVSHASIRVIGSGHGQGNLDNCAEFCGLKPVVKVNGTAFPIDLFRSDCSKNPIGPGQAGTWQHARNGFCPGAVVVPHVVDVSSALLAGQKNAFSFDVASPAGGAWENTCRPGAGGPANTCNGCAFDASPGNCDYNTTFHTPPNFQVSVQLVQGE
jgi:hypothetical protein